ADDDLGQGLTTASISVSPFDRPEAGGVTGAAASVIRALGRVGPCAATGRRIPILHGFRLALPQPKRDARRRVARARRPLPIYSCKRGAQSPRRAINRPRSAC